jgi:hypothetical protein
VGLTKCCISIEPPPHTHSRKGSLIYKMATNITNIPIDEILLGG